MNENDFVTEKYAEFRASLNEIQPCVAFAPYDWLKLPNAVDLTKDGTLPQMVYREMAKDFAQSLANDINFLIRTTRKLQAWLPIVELSNAQDKVILMHEFMESDAIIALITPYSIKERFLFSVAHLSHQANSVMLNNWSDDIKTLPEDKAIRPKHIKDLTKGWNSWGPLDDALGDLDSEYYRNLTDEYRNVYTHRITPRIEVGITHTMKRLCSDKAKPPKYAFGGTNPIRLESAVDALTQQCQCLEVCFSLFQKMVDEQVDALFR